MHRFNQAIKIFKVKSNKRSAAIRLGLFLTISIVFVAAVLPTTAPVKTAEASNKVFLSPPFYGPSKLGFTYRSKNLRPTAHSYQAMLDYYGHTLYHPYPAIDFNLPIGRPIRAVAKGVVALKGHETDANRDEWPRRPDRFVLIEHGKSGLPQVTAYKHLSRTANIKLGQVVKRGQVIGWSGHDKMPSPHLHFDAFDSVEGFNLYQHQVNYGTFQFWQCGRLVRMNIHNAKMGRKINPQPTKLASIRNCGL